MLFVPIYGNACIAYGIEVFFMDRFIIDGAKSLGGEIIVDTSKNASLPIIAASILSSDKIILKSLPQIADVQKMLDILQSLGAKVEKWESDVCIDASFINGYEISEQLTKEIRSSIFMLGPMIAKLGKAKVAYPGGCKIGNRPIDLHLSGLRELGIDIKEEDGYICCDGSNFRGGVVNLSYPSVGATENLLMVGTLAENKTVKIINAAKEPEIVDLANFINKMGGCVQGAGTGTIVVKGVKELKGVKYKPIADRIVTGTYLLAAAMTGGKITLKHCDVEHVFSLIIKLRNSGCMITTKNDNICIESYKRMSACPSVSTQPYPGFPTDLQAPMMSMLTVADGISVIKENLFESRFKHVPELVKMGAKIQVRDSLAIIRGVEGLCGTNVVAEDLRGGAALVLAGLCASGTTVVENIKYIDRGYENFEQKLSMLGARIERK